MYKLKQEQSGHWEQKDVQSPTHKKLLGFESAYERKNRVFRNMIPGRHMIFEWKITYLRVNGQHKLYVIDL